MHPNALRALSPGRTPNAMMGNVSIITQYSTSPKRRKHASPRLSVDQTFEAEREYKCMLCLLYLHSALNPRSRLCSVPFNTRSASSVPSEKKAHTHMSSLRTSGTHQCRGCLLCDMYLTASPAIHTSVSGTSRGTPAPKRYRYPCKMPRLSCPTRHKFRQMPA